VIIRLTRVYQTTAFRAIRKTSQRHRHVFKAHRHRRQCQVRHRAHRHQVHRRHPMAVRIHD
jgi:hypothetical protein